MSDFEWDPDQAVEEARRKAEATPRPLSRKKLRRLGLDSSETTPEMLESLVTHHSVRPRSEAKVTASDRRSQRRSGSGWQ